MGAPELQGEDGHFRAMVEQPAELRMVMGFGGGKLLHVGEEWFGRLHASTARRRGCCVWTVLAVRRVGIRRIARALDTLGWALLVAGSKLFLPSKNKAMRCSRTVVRALG
jgi:hypothetical protein